MWDIAVDPVDTNKLYTAHERICLTVNRCVRDSGGISKSVDGGRHWTALLKDIDVEQVIIDPFGSGTVYAGSDFGGWRRSTNGGATWTSFDISGASLNDGLTGSPLAPSQLAWIRVFFATNGKLYGAADLFGAMMLQTQAPARSRSVRH